MFYYIYDTGVLLSILSLLLLLHFVDINYNDYRCVIIDYGDNDDDNTNSE